VEGAKGGGGGGREEKNMEMERNACFHFIVVFWLLKSEGYLFSRVILNK